MQVPISWRTFLTASKLNPRISAVLDMTRWLAASLVLVEHISHNVLVEPAYVAHPDRWGTWLVYLLTNTGAQAVIWFFVISGFLVGGAVITEMAKGRFDFERYTLNRVARLYVVILPALVVGYGLDLWRVAMFGIDPGAGGESPESYGVAPFLINLFCLQTILGPTLGSNSPLWSLACEGWYYVLFPLLLAPLLTDHPLWKRAALVVLALLVILLLLQNPRILRLFVIWLLGVAVRFCPPPPSVLRSRWLAWAACAATFVAYSVMLQVISSAASLVVAAGFAWVLLVERHSGAGESLRGARVHTALASFSFSLYVTHAPVLHLVLTGLKGTSDPRLHLQPAGVLPLVWSIGLFGVVALFAAGFAKVTEENTSRVRAALAHLVGYTRGLRLLSRGR
jgi:peptidoglycan/LPS O-acetylase OafA/YrhL